jgi:hypothetical protein
MNLKGPNSFNKEQKHHMKFATIVINISTCKGIEPLKLAFLAQVTYNQPI